MQRFALESSERYDRRYDEEANRARRRDGVPGKPERHTRENFPHTTIHHHSHSGGTKSQCETNSTRGIRRSKLEEKLAKRRLSAASSWDEAQALAKIEHESTQDPPTHYQVYEEHACSLFLYALSDEPFSNHMSTNLCSHTRPRRPPQHIQCPSSP